MAVHPFARKLEDAIVEANRLLEGMLAARAAAENVNEPIKYTRKPTKIFGRVNLGGLASGSAERQVAVDPGEANASRVRDYKRDSVLQRLNQEYFRQLQKCMEARRVATANGKKNVQIPCPGAKRIADQIARYFAQSGPNSGGGGGGGW